LTRELLNPAQLTSVTIALRETEMVLRRMLDDMDKHETGVLLPLNRAWNALSQQIWFQRQYAVVALECWQL
jgi:hypothetical protein